MALRKFLHGTYTGTIRCAVSSVGTHSLVFSSIDRALIRYRSGYCYRYQYDYGYINLTSSSKVSLLKKNIYPCLISILTLKTAKKNCSRRHFNFQLLSFEENKVYFYVLAEDSLETSSLIFSEKNK